MGLNPKLTILSLGLLIALSWFLRPVFYECLPITKQQRAKHSAVQFATALEAYRVDNGDYPHGSQAEIIRVLRGDSSRKTVYFEVLQKSLNGKGELVDPWSNPYRVEFGDYISPRISSAGKNKVFDGDASGSDDICSWR